MVETINKLKKVTRQLAQELNRKPTEQELAKAMDVSLVKLHEIIKAAKEPISLETPIGKEEDSRLGDFIEDAETDRPETTVTHELLNKIWPKCSTNSHHVSATYFVSASAWMTDVNALWKKSVNSSL